LTTTATKGLYASWYITACKASFNKGCSFPKASKNRFKQRFPIVDTTQYEIRGHLPTWELAQSCAVIVRRLRVSIISLNNFGCRGTITYITSTCAMFFMFTSQTLIRKYSKLDHHEESRNYQPYLACDMLFRIRLAQLIRPAR
jgi:hypothetical protein